MTVDMGNIAWPVRSSISSGRSSVQIGSAKLDRQVAYTGNVLTVTAIGTDGKPNTEPLDVTFTERDGTDLHRTTNNGTLDLTGIPAGRYRITVNGTVAGPLRVL